MRLEDPRAAIIEKPIVEPQRTNTVDKQNATPTERRVSLFGGIKPKKVRSQSATISLSSGVRIEINQPFSAVDITTLVRTVDIERNNCFGSGMSLRRGYLAPRRVVYPILAESGSYGG